MGEPSLAFIHSVFPQSLCVCALSCFSGVQLYANLWTEVHQAPLSMGFSGQEYWSGLPCSPPETSPNPGIKPISPVSPALQKDSLSPEQLRKPTTEPTMVPDGCFPESLA